MLSDHKWPPPLGREILGAANGVPSFGDCGLVSPFFHIPLHNAVESSMKAWPAPHLMKTTVPAIFVGMCS
jgi:hypothetical protein